VTEKRGVSAQRLGAAPKDEARDGAATALRL
jgi:hypothetical protein